MQRTRNIKWGLVAAMLILALSLCAACTRNRITPNGNLNYGATTPGIGVSDTGTHVIEGYIVDFDGSRVTVEQVEFLTTSHTSRINELGLDTTRDFVNGYYIVNDGTRGSVTYPLANNVQVRFADVAANGVNNVSGLNGGVGYHNVTSTMPGYTPNNATTGIMRDVNAGTGTDTTVNHLGHTLGGTVSGIIGGVEMLTNRHSNGATATHSKTPYFITIQNGYVTHIEEVGAYSNFAGTSAYNTTGTNTHTTTGIGTTTR